VENMKFNVINNSATVYVIIVDCL